MPNLSIVSIEDTSMRNIVEMIREDAEIHLPIFLHVVDEPTEGPFMPGAYDISFVGKEKTTMDEESCDIEDLQYINLQVYVLKSDGRLNAQSFLVALKDAFQMLKEQYKMYPNLIYLYSFHSNARIEYKELIREILSSVAFLDDFLLRKKQQSEDTIHIWYAQHYINVDAESHTIFDGTYRDHKKKKKKKKKK